MTGRILCRLGLHKWAGPPENRYCLRCGRAHPKVEEHLQRLLEEKKREARARGSGHADEGNPRGPSS
jgi:hypothetical protein